MDSVFSHAAVNAWVQQAGVQPKYWCHTSLYSFQMSTFRSEKQSLYSQWELWVPKTFEKLDALNV